MSAGRPSPAPRVRRPDIRRPVLSARAGAALGVVVILITILAIPFREWITQGARIAELESQVAWHTQRVSDLQAAYEESPLVRVLPAGRLPELRSVVGTPFAEIGASVLPGARQAVVVCAIDNLLKGAASQAVQNLNRMLGLPEDEGLR